MHAIISTPMGSSTTSAAIVLRNLCKSFGNVVAVDDVNLDVLDGEFLTLLGPSGSGKTTVLRMIAGFEMPSSGFIALDGRDVTSVPAFDRDVNTVFQNYALFPHMTVMENVEYGLMVKGVGRQERRQRAREMLDAVRLVGFDERKSSQLSGGQQQRVALARALVNHPRVLLLDEPLGALDLKLREEMQVELKSIQQRVGITFVYVTHDQGEALSMSDRVVVFNAGRIEQVGTPRDIYERPQSVFVAGFVGITNLFSGARAVQYLGRDGVFALRPEYVNIRQTQAGFAAVVGAVQYLGADCRVHCRLEDGGIVVSSGPSSALGVSVGDQVYVSWVEDCLVEIGQRL